VVGGTYRELPTWRQEGTKAFSQTNLIPPGNWALLVENNLNILKRMTVRAFVTLKE
jgi:hypothetical protein